LLKTNLQMEDASRPSSAAAAYRQHLETLVGNTFDFISETETLLRT
jgi:hypothetical protein